MKSLCKIVALITVLLTIIVSKTEGQTKMEQQGQLWAGFYLTALVTDKLFVGYEIENRAFIAPVLANNAFMTSAYVGYSFAPNWTLIGGCEYFLQYTHHPKESKEAIDSWVQNPANAGRDTSESVGTEVTPFFILINSAKYGKVSLSHSFTTLLYMGNDVETWNDKWRYGFMVMRYRLKFSVPIVKINENQNFYFTAYNETLLAGFSKYVGTDGVFLENRLYAGFGVDICRGLSADFGYLNQVKNRYGNGFQMRHGFRFIMNYTLDLRKKEIGTVASL